ncbi:MAG: DegT/DnrJ/EryC1/StrS family aminotransferase [Clostridia bacterium]|nr:DegT/DnrJ/EryC1/StrS family aminotransferase [Clostridia bacterium]
MMNKVPIPFCDLSRQHRRLYDEYVRAAGEVLGTADFCNGRFVKGFEKDFAAFCGVSYAAAVDNGTDAVFLALKALGIGEGDEVIIPSNTFVATAWGAVYNGATPVFCDIDPDTWEIDPADLEKRITKATKAIVGVHLYGVPFDFDRVKGIADAHGIPVVEDCAQAHGALYKGKKTGSLGELGCFSFYPTKNLGACGDAGCVVSGDREKIKLINSFKTHCTTADGDHSDVGFNMRMDDIQAAILSVKLRHLDGALQRRREISGIYDRGITNPLIVKQKYNEDSSPARHLYVIHVSERDRFLRHMSDLGIDCRVHYPLPCHLMKAFGDVPAPRFPLGVSEYHAAHCVTLPLFPELTREEIERIIDACDRFGG